jgi:hypothetical protein
MDCHPTVQYCNRDRIRTYPSPFIVTFLVRTRSDAGRRRSNSQARSCMSSEEGMSRRVVRFYMRAFVILDAYLVEEYWSDHDLNHHSGMNVYEISTF